MPSEPIVERGFPLYSYAFQPIVDVVANTLFAYEALIRGAAGESAGTVLAQAASGDLHEFDRTSRLQAVRIAGRLGVTCRLTLNVLPHGLDESQRDLRALIETARLADVPLEHLIIEITEGEAIHDHTRFTAIVDDYRACGIQIAIDDFGAGYAGLNLLADFQPDLIKLDMSLVREIDTRGPRQSIVRAVTMVCQDLGIDVIAEGVETIEELAWLQNSGVRLFQGYLLGRPEFERLSPPTLIKTYGTYTR